MAEKLEETTDKVIEIDYQEIFTVLWSRKMLIVLITILGAVIGYIYAAFFQVPVYKASTTLYVLNEQNQKTGNINLNDVYLSQALAGPYIIIIRSDRILEQVAYQMGGNYTADILRSEVTAEAVDETEVLKITVSDLNPENSAKIANILAQILRNEIVEIVHGGSVEIIDEAKVPEKPTYGISVLKSIFLGGFLVFILICLLFAVLTVLDTRIKSQNKLARLFDFPVLGEIPPLLVTHKSQSYGYRTGYRTEYAYRENRVEKES